MMHIFYAFCGGAFGAILGGSAAFALTGVFCAISMAALLGGADAPFLHTAVAFGPMMLPAVSYAAGATSAHYARWRGYVPYGDGRNTDRALMHLGRPDVILFGGFIGAKHSRFSKNLAVCTRSMEELAEEQERKTPKMLRNARTRPGWAEDQVGQLLLRYSTSIRSQFGFFRKDILLIEWSPERLELLQDMYPGIPWTDLTENMVLDAERNA